MRIGLLADLHGNVEGLRACLAAIGDVDRMLLAGDALNSYRMQAEMMELIAALGIGYVLGNNEASLLRHSPAERRRPEDRRAWEMLATAPTRLELELGDRRLLMVHSTPWGPADDYLYPGDPRLAAAAELDFDYLVYGHTHVPHEQRAGTTLVINPGSAGDARGWKEGLLSCAVLDTAADAVTFLEQPDPALAPRGEEVR
ncbi:MAG: metallophosphoesterase family protein [Solirubrobacterales bacterium]